MEEEKLRESNKGTSIKTMVNGILHVPKYQDNY